MEGKQIPQGRAQISPATEVVKSRFGQASALFAIDQLVKGVLRTITGLLQGIATRGAPVFSVGVSLSADAALFFASDRASLVTRAAMLVDRGHSITRVRGSGQGNGRALSRSRH